ncbi:MAG: hypothetical protein ACLT8E_02785 [Akkermansia sp.]
MKMYSPSPFPLNPPPPRLSLHDPGRTPCSASSSRCTGMALAACLARQEQTLAGWECRY